MNRRLPALLLSIIILLYLTAFSFPEIADQPYPIPEQPDRALQLKIYRPMVDLDKVDWIQWFGPTVFSYEDGDFWDYDEYCQGQHCGLDLGAPWGTPLYSGIFGIVKYVSNERIEIWYGEGQGHGWWKVVYTNIADYYVKSGQFVTPNTVIGTVGNHRNDPDAVGIYASHLHLEVRYDPNPYVSFKSEFHNPLIYFYDQNIFEKLNEIAIRQFATNDWYYMRDALMMGVDHPMDVTLILRGRGTVSKSWYSWQGEQFQYDEKSYYLETYPGPILNP